MNNYTDVLKKYVVFDGRATRHEYWMFVLFNFIIYAILVLLSHIIGMLAFFLIVLFGLAIFLPTLAVGVRRLHDTNRSGWWILIGLVPYIGAIVLIVFCVLDGTPGDNKYGSDPKGRPSAPVAASQPPVAQ